MKKVSIVLPCLNEVKNIPLLIPAIIENVPRRFTYEIICVDDGSDDGTNLVIKKLAQKNNRIKGIIFYRRFGHQLALTAGIEKAKGDAIITMDADLQHPPEMIPQLISLWEKGYDLILPQKKADRTRNPFYKLSRQIVYWLWTKASGGTLIPGVSDFRLMDKKVAQFILSSQETEVFIRGLVNLIANKPIIIPYSVRKRRFGHSAYNLRALTGVFLTGFISFSTKPLRIAAVFGLLLALVTAIFLIFDTVRSIVTGQSIIPGWLTVVALILILNGFSIFYMGILGEYLGVIFKEVKKRPTHLIDQTINL